ncbi:DinB family protein [Fodinicola feengrottensis]|uniref:DinB family protein n=1 Tax=Fodinicola feengrottensis TaxID=435914 RepID=A0ABN2IN23_9ACTN
MDIDWTTQLADQLDWHWTNQARPRLDGLTDDEYFWEPVPDCWSVRVKSDSKTTIDFAYPPPNPAPVTTIAWRLAHVIIGVFTMRNASHFGGPPADYDTYDYASTADQALKQLDGAYERWIAGVRSLDAAALALPCGPAEGPYADLPMGALVLHINREAIHHFAEIALLRDLYLRR